MPTQRPAAGRRAAVRRATPPANQPVQAARNVAPATASIGNTPAPFAGGQVASGARVGFLGNKSIFDTPYSVIPFTEKLIQDKIARNLNDVVQSSPGVQVANPYGANLGWNFISPRGFTPDQASQVMYDGLPGLPYFRPTLEHIERVEVFLGPTTTLTGGTGFGSVAGGVINFVPKMATDADVTRLTTSYNSDSLFGAHIDVGRRYGENKEWGIRANGAFSYGDTYIDNSTHKLASGAISADYRGERFRVKLDYDRSDQRFQTHNPALSLGALTSLPAVPNPSTAYGQLWFGQLRGPSERVLGRAEADVLENWTVGIAAGKSETHYTQFRTFPVLTSLAGKYTAGSVSAETGERLSVSGEAYVRGEVWTGLIKHNIATSVGTNTLDTNFRVISLPGYVSNIYNPVYLPDPGFPFQDPRRFATNSANSFAIADQLSVWGDRLQFIVAARHVDIKQRTFDNTTSIETLAVQDSKWTPTYAVLVKPIEWMSLYANYIETLESGTIAAPGTTNQGQLFPSFLSIQKEAGAKFNFNNNLGVTLAVFDITRPSPISFNNTQLQNIQEHKGFELSVFGEPIKGWRVLAAYSNIDPRVKDAANPAFIGKLAPSVATNVFVASTEVDLPWIRGLTLTGGMQYYSNLWLDQLNTFNLPSRTVFDVGSRYEFWAADVKYTARFLVRNVTDERYWQATPTAALQVNVGQPRTYAFSLTADFSAQDVVPVKPAMFKK